MESFLLRDVEGGTEVVYQGELGADLWAAESWRGRRLVPLWERIVGGSLEEVCETAEARTAMRGGRAAL